MTEPNTQPDRAPPLTIDDVTVNVEWWATFWGLSRWSIRGMVAGGTDPRMPPPLPIPGPYRWLRSTAIAHIESLGSK